MYLLGACLLFLAIWFYFSRKRARNGQWQNYGYGMRRFINGRWEYRDPTSPEETDRQDGAAW